MEDLLKLNKMIVIYRAYIFPLDHLAMRDKNKNMFLWMYLKNI